MSTGGLVVWLDRLTDWEGQLLIRGFADDLLQLLPADAIFGPPEELWGSQDPEAVAYWEPRAATSSGTVVWTPSVDPEILKIAYSDLLLDRGVKLLLHSWGVAPIQEGPGVHGAIFESKSGRQAILADVVIDATGDGDIFAAAGAAFETDIDELAMNARMNVSYRFGGVDTERFLEFQQHHRDESRAIAERARRELGYGAGCVPLPLPGQVVFMGPKLAGYSTTDVEDLTGVEIESRRIMLRAMAFHKENVPGFEHAYILDTSPQLGVRHSRRLVGVKKITRADWDAFQAHRDEIGLCPGASPHHPPFSVPLGCLVPERLDNLIAAGRNLSCDWRTHDYLRQVPECWMLGQGAGVAAAVAVRAGVRVREVDVADVQCELVRQGALLRTSLADAD
jgi:hypothetical protein